MSKSNKAKKITLPKPILTDDEKKKVAHYASHREIIGEKGCLAQCLEFQSYTLRGYSNKTYNLYLVESYGYVIATYNWMRNLKRVNDTPKYDKAKARQHIEMAKEWLAIDCVVDEYIIDDNKRKNI